MDQQQPAKKKQRKNAAKAMDFCMTISSPSSFKNMCDVMDSILPHFHFQVVKSDTFQGLKIRQMDESHCALLSIRYKCEVQVKCDDDDLSFCVNKKTWRQFMKQINTTAVLKICRYEGEDSITILCNDDEHSGKHKYTTNTLDVDLDDVGDAQEIECEKTIEIDLEECKKFWRLCSSQECEEVRFRFLLPPFEQLKDGVFHMQFQNTQIKQVSGSRMFHSHFVDDKLIADFKSTVNEEEDYADWKEIYNQEFAVKLLNTFTKNLEKEQRLSIGITQDQPLVINYNLGIEKSHIRFYVAPKCEEEE